MKKILFSLFVFIGTSSFAHEFYFGFAEVEYNEIAQKFELTLVMSTHDMELAFREDLKMDTELSKLHMESEETRSIESYLRRHFSLRATENIEFYLLGFETFANGITHFYLESDIVDLNSQLDWKFDLLMSHFPEQQNKCTFYLRDQQHTLTFLPATPTQTLKLETKGL